MTRPFTRRTFLGLTLLLSACGRGNPPLSNGAPTLPEPQRLSPLPPNWPATLQLGMADSPGGAAAMRATAPFGFRYQYLAGGVNIGKGWPTWNANGEFVSYYIEDSRDYGIAPVFTYYQLLQSAPGSGKSEAERDFANLQNAATMAAYFNDLRLFFQKAGAFPGTGVVLHVEPDFWGYMQQKAKHDDATSVPVQVAATGLAELAGLPDNLSGLSQAVVRLRDAYAPNALLAYHLSTWGTGANMLFSKPGESEVRDLATRSARFYSSLRARFDLTFAEFLDRDSGFYEYQYKNPHAWYSAADYRRLAGYLATFGALAQQRLALWQIPYGNTKMRRENNQWDRYQSNQVETLLGDPSRAYLSTLANAGVVALLFGRGADGATCACDADGDGMAPDPPPIDGNTGASINADDDGGYFRQQAARYYATGPLPLPAS
jgi:hypothetical protein